MSDRITKLTDFSVDIRSLQDQSNQFLNPEVWNKHNQLCFLNTSGHPADLHQGVGNTLAPGYPMSGLNESDFTVFNPNHLDTIFYKIYSEFPYPITRMRLMQIPPKRCYSLHSDGVGEIRYHIPVFTNSGAYFFYQDPIEAIHLPADGSVYKVQVEDVHSAVNFSATESRLHLVLNAKL